MKWKVLDEQEIIQHLPLNFEVVAAIAELSDDGELYSDTIVTLNNQGIIDLPPNRLPIDDLYMLLDILLGVANKKVRDESHQNADPQ